MKNPFLIDSNIDGRASLNQVTVGTNTKSGASTTAIDLLAAEYLITTIRENKILPIPQDFANHSIPPLLNTWIKSENLAIKKTSLSIVEQYVENVMLLLKTIRSKDQSIRSLRENWTYKDWDFWLQNKQYIFTGGLMAGAIGTRLKTKFDETFPDLNCIIPKHPQLCPLLGASLDLNSDVGIIIAFDFGQSFIKRAILTVENNTIASAKLFPSISTQRSNNIFNFEVSDQKKAFNAFFSSVFNQSVQELHSEINQADFSVSCSFANYVTQTGFADRGVYGLLNKEGQIFTDVLKESLDTLNIFPKEISMSHDGSAAAQCFSNHYPAACITFGSALGLGFPPMKEKPLKVNLESIKIVHG